MVLNTDLKILADGLQTVLPSLIGPQHSCVVKSRPIQGKLHLVRTIIKIGCNAALINLDLFKVFDSVDHGFLLAVLSADEFRLNFRSWIRLLYASPGVIVAVNEVRTKPSSLSRSIRQSCPLSPKRWNLSFAG